MMNREPHSSVSFKPSMDRWQRVFCRRLRAKAPAAGATTVSSAAHMKKCAHAGNRKSGWKDWGRFVRHTDSAVAAVYDRRFCTFSETALTSGVTIKPAVIDR